MQFQSDMLEYQGDSAGNYTETTALGAAYLAGLAVGYWKNMQDIQSQWKVDKTFSPSIDDTKKNELITGWKKAVKAAVAWTKG